MLYLVDLFHNEKDSAQVYADKGNILNLMKQGQSLCINYGSQFLDVVEGEFVNPVPAWFR